MTSYMEFKLTGLKKKWTLLMVCSIVCVSSSNSIDIRWVDYMNDIPPEVDVFFDRIVAIVYNGPRGQNSKNNRTVIAPGVLFDDSLVLTSFNPFRKYISNTTEHNITVDILHTRFVHDGEVTGYQLNKYDIDCARQVNPDDSVETQLAKNNISDIESPLHDLMVIRLQGKVTFLDPEESNNDKFKNKTLDYIRAGPIKTILASKTSKFKRNVRFASFGYRTEEEMMKFNNLHRTVYQKSDFAVANCLDWMPYGWGHFICIKNIYQYEGIGSGAMLFYKNKLLGVGSFLMGRKDESVFVFTDVRPYYDFIQQTCKNEDQSLEIKDNNETI